MGQHKKQTNMSYDQQLQFDAAEVVRKAKDLVGIHAATWMTVELPNNQTGVALVFKSSMWELKDERLMLKPRRTDESDKTVANGNTQENGSRSGLSETREDTDAT